MVPRASFFPTSDLQKGGIASALEPSSSDSGGLITNFTANGKKGKLSKWLGFFFEALLCDLPRGVINTE